MNILHILASGGTGGIETLCKDYAIHSNNKNIFVFLWKTGEIAEEMKKLGISTYCLQCSKKNILKSFHLLCDICKTNNIDSIVVHHAAPLAHIYMMRLKKKYPNIRTFAYAHGSAEDMCRHKQSKGLALRKRILKSSLNKADKTIAISEFVRISLIKYLGVSENKIKVIYNGVDTERFNCKIHNKDKTLELIYVGRLIEEKGVQNTIRALSTLDSYIDYCFKIVGTGSYESELKKLVNNYNLQDKITFLGNRRDVPKLLSESDIFIHMPNWEEGFGITIVEAMSAGLICVCLNKGAIPEIIDNNKNGIIVDNLNDFNEIMKMLYNNDTKINQIKDNAICKAKEFSIQKYVEQMDKLMKISD